MPNKKILFVIPSFAGGGAEHVVATLLKGIDLKRFSPYVVVFSKDNVYTHIIPEDIEIECLDKKNALDFFKLIYRLSRIISSKKPFAIISFLNYANYLTAIAVKTTRLKIPFFVSERSNLSRDLNTQRFSLIKRFLITYLYPKATSVIAVSKGVKEDLCNNFRIPEEKCYVIYNPLDIYSIIEKSNEIANHPWLKKEIPVIITCGRLNAQKNYPLLLKSISKVLNEMKVRLMILGEGEERQRLESLAFSLGISEKVAFLGFQNNPYKYIAKADIFVLSSDFEGFPNVILEAMACGTPVISTKCPSGPDEIITDGENGLLVPVNDEDAMAEAILRLLQDKELRERLANAGKKRAEDFRIEKIVRQYEELFERQAIVKP